MLIELTSSQLMALKDLVAHYLLLPGRTEMFLDCSERPAVGTTPEDLLAALLGGGEIVVMDTPLTFTCTYCGQELKCDDAKTHGCFAHLYPSRSRAGTPGT